MSLVLTVAAALQLAAMSPWSTEAVACLVGHADTVTAVIVLSTDRSATSVVLRTACPDGTIGHAHNHPGADRCWYVFPGTSVPTSDGVSAALTGLPYDVIVCGKELVVRNQKGDVEVQPL